MKNRLLPHPSLTIALTLLWLLLVNSLDMGNIVLGIILGLVIPWFTDRFWRERPKIVNYPLLFRFFLGTFLYDVIVSNFTVVRLILKPDISTLQPGFIEIPLDTSDSLVISILASVISLTPGTVSSDVSEDRTMLLVHNLHVPDKQAAIDGIKSRYEATLKEIFGC
ncbi:Na+/H+ antiporter subunit E [Chrysiogenes arsenatis]|uniref:Na+/H+ antiporter subunit E n=1 Tax=Chrysiogenes arsenatis TaxID=309797 RepID=UPI0004259968|nr:Na+/H+ antiporter subunit E [Chrysiogenes arsenatis]